MNFLLFKRKSVFAALLFLCGCVSLPKDQQTENLICPPDVTASLQKACEQRIFLRGQLA